MERGIDTPANDYKQRHIYVLAYANGGWWSLGNGLASTSLIIYLAKQLGAEGLQIGAILAAPYLVGWLRLLAPTIIGRYARKQQFCIACFVASALVLVSVASMAQPGQLRFAENPLTVIVVLWCVYHLFEFLATVALWSWLGDLIPLEIRGEILGRRERIMMLTRIVGMVAGGAFAYWWPKLCLDDPLYAWLRYAGPAWGGAVCMLIAVFPLMKLNREWIAGPTRELSNSINWKFLLAELASPWRDTRMRSLMAFSMAYSLANGITQSAQFLYPLLAVGLTLLARHTMMSTMRLGQAGLAGWVGRKVDTLGSRQVLIVGQLIVATGPFFMLLGCKLHWGFLWLTWLAWIAYVGLNIAIPTRCLKLAGPRRSSAYVAMNFAAAGVVYAIFSVIGGFLADHWQQVPPLVLGPLVIDHMVVLFGAGFILRTLAVVWLLRSD